MATNLSKKNALAISGKLHILVSSWNINKIGKNKPEIWGHLKYTSNFHQVERFLLRSLYKFSSITSRSKSQNKYKRIQYNQFQIIPIKKIEIPNEEFEPLKPRDQCKATSLVLMRASRSAILHHKQTLRRINILHHHQKITHFLFQKSTPRNSP